MSWLIKLTKLYDSLHLRWGPEGLLKKEVKAFTLDGKSPKLGKRFDDFGYEIYTFDKPLQPKDTITLELEVAAYYKRFPNEGSGSTIVNNGTFLNNNFFPSFGYSAQGE
jgi:ABC-2 type transport system permease protein